MSRLIRGGRVVTATDAFDADVLIDGESIVADRHRPLGRRGDRRLRLPGAAGAGRQPHPPLDAVRRHLELRRLRHRHRGGRRGRDDVHRRLHHPVRRRLAEGRARGVARAAPTAPRTSTTASTWRSPTPRPEVDRRDGASASQEGITSFKVFMAYKGALMVDDEQFLAVLEQTGKTGGLVMVHCENGDAVVRYQKEAMAAGNTDPKFHACDAPARGRGRGHGPRDPARGVDQAAAVRRPRHLRGVGASEIQAARDRGLPIFGETCIQYLYLTVDDLDRPDFEGAKYVCSPPLREEQQPGGALPGAAPGRAAGHLAPTTARSTSKSRRSSGSATSRRSRTGCRRSSTG